MCLIEITDLMLKLPCPSLGALVFSGVTGSTVISSSHLKNAAGRSLPEVLCENLDAAHLFPPDS